MMIFHKIVEVISCIFFINVCIAERRIRNGNELSKLEDAKSYMVFLVKAPVSEKQYDNWLCGGALVTPQYIVTSAACVDDVKYMYAIAGSLTSDLDITSNRCKKKVIMTCIPKGFGYPKNKPHPGADSSKAIGIIILSWNSSEYRLEYGKIDTWASIDIAVVKVESSHTPEHCWGQPIEINYQSKFQEPGIDTVTFGYGSLDKWRQENDTRDNNGKILQYASLLILDKKTCKNYYNKDDKLLDIIDKYMICTVNGGGLDHNGNVLTIPVKVDGCVYPRVLRDGHCIYPEYNRRKLRTNETISTNTSICQNDHGGPLVTWVGSKAMLIGIASVFRINDQWQCEGPNLFTSTHCNGKFLDCILNPAPLVPSTENPNDTRPVVDHTRRYLGDCNNPAVMGFNIVRKHISWANHPDGPAANEEPAIRRRPQIPLSELPNN